eukprot:TRINITY_DN4907_c0_g1_i1.p1 TRINITY_DN4907_c0_g1~~TRINITY_DN4907_c0_g1_i1.p1  ORF type:complete len:892 (+),score=159.66 TRINITY_DN4907_c0_g1_i1:55-2730(+)
MPFPPFTRPEGGNLSSQSTSLLQGGPPSNNSGPKRFQSRHHTTHVGGLAAVARIKVHINSFPPDVQGDLTKVDKSGDGTLDADELLEIFSTYQKLMKEAGSGELKVSMMPREIQSVLQVFDKDGDGTISTKELSKAADLFEASHRQVRNLVRLAVLLGFAICGVIIAIGVLTFFMMDISKQSKIDPAQSVETVKAAEGAAPTAVAVAKVIETKTLFDSHTEPLDVLKAVNSLDLNSKDGTQTFAYTITGFKKEDAAGAVTFYSSRGDEIRCTGTDIIVTSACEVAAGQTSCTGAPVLSLTKADLQARRRLLQEQMDEVVLSGRRLKSNEMRVLQTQLTAAQDPRSRRSPKNELGARNRVPPCADGTAPTAAGECPEPCADNMPQVCPPREAGNVSCQCPTVCDTGLESCVLNPGAGGWRCSSLDLPFQNKSTGCVPICSEFRNLTTGQCMVTCSDGATTVPVGQTSALCPMVCPDLRDRALRMGLSLVESNEVLGVAYQPERISATTDVEADVALQVTCPRLCGFKDPYTASGVKVIQTDASRDFACPRKCYGLDGTELKDRYSASSVYAWPDEECPKVCPQTGTYVPAGSECPIYCPDLSGNPIEVSPGVKMTFSAFSYVAKGSSADAMTVQQAVCPEPCTDGTYDWVGNGCTTGSDGTAGPALVECPGKPTNCDEEVIRVTDESLCPLQCPTLRNCELKEDGLLYPDSEKVCPAPCEGTQGVFDVGFGCPGTCASMEGLPGMPENGWALAPYWTCPVVCPGADGVAIMRNGAAEHVYPVKEKTDPVTGKKEILVLAMSEEEVQATMCPIPCGDETFVEPYWTQDVDGWWLKSLNGQDSRNCPTRCDDGTTVVEKYGERCGAASTILKAGLASTKAGYDMLDRPTAPVRL